MPRWVNDRRVPSGARGDREAETRGKLLLCQAQALAQAGNVYRMRLIEFDPIGLATCGICVCKGLVQALLDAVECACHMCSFQDSNQI